MGGPVIDSRAVVILAFLLVLQRLPTAVGVVLVARSAVLLVIQENRSLIDVVVVIVGIFIFIKFYLPWIKKRRERNRVNREYWEKKAAERLGVLARFSDSTHLAEGDFGMLQRRRDDVFHVPVQPTNGTSSDDEIVEVEAVSFEAAGWTVDRYIPVAEDVGLAFHALRGDTELVLTNNYLGERGLRYIVFETGQDSARKLLNWRYSRWKGKIFPRVIFPGSDSTE